MEQSVEQQWSVSESYCQDDDGGGGGGAVAGL